MNARIYALLSLLMVGLAGCAKPPAATTEIVMAPVEVGTATPDYEVVSPVQLRLKPGTTLQMIKSDDGSNKGFLLLKQSGGLGGYMACGCVGATTSSCKTENDNPDHASCSGSCTDSEGNAHPCQIEGPIVGPPKDPFTLKFVARAEELLQPR